MEKRLIIIGKGGQGRVIHDIAVKLGYKNIFFLDDKPSDDENHIGKVSDAELYIKDSEFIVGIGDSAIRKKIFHFIDNLGAKIISLIHPSAVIGENVTIGRGVAIMAGAVVNCGSEIHDGAIINTCASVDHDCVVGKFSHVSVGAHLAGTVLLGEEVYIWSGAIISNNINISDGVIVGAGAVVIRHINKKGVYVGVPARKTIRQL